MSTSRPSYAETRERLRWQVAFVLVALMSALMLALGIANTRMGFADMAILAWTVLGLNALGLVGLLVLPRRVGSTLFFAAILALTIFSVAFGWWHERPLYYWGFLFPPVVVFLLRPWAALAAMIVYGAFVAALTSTLLPGIDVIRFVSVYGLMVCFVTTYALLEQRAGLLLREQSDRDGLTGCFNRRRFNEALAQLATPRVEAMSLGMLLVDVDHFKVINDTRGHLEGDRVLVAIAEVLADTLVSTPRAALYRYGGEEFAVLVPGIDASALARLAEALRDAVDQGGAGLVPREVSISVGASLWRQASESPEAALQRADEALYAAKNAGRNRMTMAS